MMRLPVEFLRAPLAHRAFHDLYAGRPENSRAAMTAAIERGYGIELDLQLSGDGQAMVFHDYDLKRLTGHSGPIRQRTAGELGELALLHGDETIPTLAEILALVDGRVPLLIEIKDQDGAMGPNVGPLEQATARDLAAYAGPVAVMSFNPHSVSAFSTLAKDVPVGLTTCLFDKEHWPLLPTQTRRHLRAIPDFDRLGACFVSHNVQDLDSTHLARIRESGAAILTWTVRSALIEAEARQFADNITFEGYEAALPKA